MCEVSVLATGRSPPVIATSFGRDVTVATVTKSCSAALANVMGPSRRASARARAPLRQGQRGVNHRDIPGLFLVSEVSVLATGRSLLSFISDMEQSAGRERDAPRHRYCTVQRHVVVGVIRTPCAAAVSVGVSRCSVGLRRLVRAQRLASRPDRVSPTLLAAASDTARAMPMLGSAASILMKIRPFKFR
jgi:hypothetical protein